MHSSAHRSSGREGKHWLQCPVIAASFGIQQDQVRRGPSLDPWLGLCAARPGGGPGDLHLTHVSGAYSAWAEPSFTGADA